MAVVAIGGDGRVAFLERRLHADDDCLLADIKVAEPADQPHAVHLSGPLLEAADQQHVAVVSEQPAVATAGSASFTGSALRLTAISLPPRGRLESSRRNLCPERW